MTEVGAKLTILMNDIVDWKASAIYMMNSHSSALFTKGYCRGKRDVYAVALNDLDYIIHLSYGYTDEELKEELEETSNHYIICSDDGRESAEEYRESEDLRGYYSGKSIACKMVSSAIEELLATL